MYEFKIEKIGCMSCVRHIEEKLKEKDAQVKLQADFKSHTLGVVSSLSKEEILKSITDAGYEAQ